MQLRFDLPTTVEEMNALPWVHDDLEHLKKIAPATDFTLVAEGEEFVAIVLWTQDNEMSISYNHDVIQSLGVRAPQELHRLLFALVFGVCMDERVDHVYTGIDETDERAVRWAKYIGLKKTETRYNHAQEGLGTYIWEISDYVKIN